MWVAGNCQLLPLTATACGTVGFQWAYIPVAVVAAAPASMLGTYLHPCSDHQHDLSPLLRSPPTPLPVTQGEYFDDDEGYDDLNDDGGDDGPVY